MPVGDELAITSKAFERFAFQDRVVAFEVPQHPGFKDEEAAVDPTFPNLWFFGELFDVVTFEDEAPKASRRTDGGDRGQPAVSAMEIQQALDIHVADTVAVRHAKRPIPDVGSEAFEAATGLSLNAGVDKIHDPVITRLVLYLDFPRPELKGEV